MARTPLAPISGNRTLEKEFNSSERSIVFGASRSGEKPITIARREKLKTSSVATIIRRYLTRPQGVSKARSGRPFKLSDRNKKSIIRVVKGELTIEYGELISQYEFKYSKFTVYRTLKEYGFVN